MNVLWEMGIEPDLVMLPASTSPVGSSPTKEAAINAAVEGFRSPQWSFWPYEPELEKRIRNAFDAHFEDLFVREDGRWRATWPAAGREVLITWRREFCLKKSSSWLVRRFRGVILPMATPRLRAAGAAPEPTHVRPTAPPSSRPSTLSLKSLMNVRRRSSPSVKILSPSSSCLRSAARMYLSSSVSSCASVVDASCRAASSSAGRRKLPTWSARYLNNASSSAVMLCS